MKQLSIIIVNYNSALYLYKCLESLRGKKSIPSNWEIIIVDNGSDEALSTTRIVELVPTAIVLKNTENIGFSRANNQAIARSTGKYVLLLNPDTVVTQEAFVYLLEFMDKNEKIGITTPKVLLASGQIDDASHRGFPTPWRAFCYFTGLSSLFPNSSVLNGYHLGYQNLDKAHEIDACVGACMLIRRTVGEAVNFLDEDYFWYGEDLDFCFKVKEAGYQVWYVPEVAITHHKGVTSGIKKHTAGVSTASAKTKRNAQIARFDAMRTFYRKHYRDKYPIVVTRLVDIGIGLLEVLYLK